MSVLTSAPSMSLAKGAGGASVKARSRGMPAVVAKQSAADGARSTTTTSSSSSLALKSVAAATAVGLLIAVPTLDAFAASSSSAPSVFVGEYADPKHPGCLRSIVGDAGATTLDVKGTDGTPGCTNGEKQRPWSLTGDIVKVPSKQDEILIDFTPKGGPKNLLGKWTGTGILFPDGNEWKKLN